MIILNKVEKLNCDTVITLGNFDGVHIGHRKLIEETKVLAKKMNAKSLVFSFFSHTNQVLENSKFKTIFTRNEKIFILKSLGIDYFLEILFDKTVAQIKSQEFLNLLIKNLNCKALVLGNDCKFGSDKSKYESKFIKRISDVTFDGKKISSSYIRSLIQQKNFILAEKLLGGKYFIMQKKSDNNFENKLLPPNGSYSTKIFVDNREFNVITDIDSRNQIVKINTPQKIFSKPALIYF